MALILLEASSTMWLDGDNMDILLTCVSYLLLIVCFSYILLGERSKMVRKKNMILEAHYENWVAVIAWAVSFIFITLFTFGYYIHFFNEFNLLSYFITVIVCLPLLAIAYYLERWRITIDGEKVIKCGLFLKTTFNISDIVKIKRSWFGYKFYLKNKKAFRVNARYHTFSQLFVNNLREKANLKSEDANRLAVKFR